MSQPGTRTVCPECYEGAHGQCIGQGCYCTCQFDLEQLDGSEVGGSEDTGQAGRFLLTIYVPIVHYISILTGGYMNRIPASKLNGGIEIMRERDIRRRGKPFNDLVECQPAMCACCGRAIYKIAELRNGDIIGSECACIIPNCPAMRMGRFLNKRQQEYAIRCGLLAPELAIEEVA